MTRAARHKIGTIVFDKRRGTWNFLQWVDGKRQSKVIGTKQEFPTKAAAWRIAQALPQPKPKPATAPTVSTLIQQYRTEKMPKRASTRRGYETWLVNHIAPKWGECELTALQARPVELWLQSLTLAPKSKAHIRGLLHVLWDYAMWRGDVPTSRNPMELVHVKDASKRTKHPGV
jgi:integrase